MAQIQWYPGHMAKAEREIASRIKLIDIVIELVDARAPLSSKNRTFDHIINNKPRLLVMTKKDLADNQASQEWQAYFEKQGYGVLLCNMKNFNEYQKIIQKCREILKEKLEREAKRGLKPRPIRAMVIGVPNVGKSTFINALAKRKAAVTGNRPGVTKSQQIIRVAKDFELFGTPGVLAPKYNDEEQARNVALIGSIKQDILPRDDLMIYALKYLNKHYPDALKARYDLTIDKDTDWVVQAFDQIAKVRAVKKVRGETDYDRVMDIFFKDLLDGAFGKISWERVSECVKD